MSWQGETARHEGLVSGCQEVGRSRQSSKGQNRLASGVDLARGFNGR